MNTLNKTSTIDEHRVARNLCGNPPIFSAC
jgi:hypothetical protein